ncbi:hypothetical protein [Rhizobium gallicum]|uniref:hypothetical protein n=1 Tax=Rhizobium gallicum TaxID=56730 RepID=UPI001EF9402A|nr:hypothetical protein [Rhizobium gallicum]ULJ74439.1 hypothetical protein L2W42_21475 [Rhizobium gallicum]
MKDSACSSASSIGVKRVELTVDDIGLVVEIAGVRSVRLTSKVTNNLPDNEVQIRELLGETLLYWDSVHGALCADRDGALLLWANIEHTHDSAALRERMMSFCKAVMHWHEIFRRHRGIKRSPLCRNEHFARDLDLHWRNVCDPKTERMDSKDLDRTMARAQQTIAQVESFLREGREQLGRQTDLLGDYGITGDVISAFVEAQDESFRQANTLERQAVLGDVITPTSSQRPVGGPRVSPMRQRV